MLLFFTLVLLLFGTNSVHGLEFGGISALEEIDLPEDLNFQVHSVCTKHTYFMQATAREDGCFAIYSRSGETYEPSTTDFKRVFIDVYDPNGTFLQELSFTTPLDLAVELTAETLNIYFYVSVLTYDLETQELRHYSIQDGAAVNGGVYKRLREKEFVSGDWTYTCKKTFDGYTQLTRSNSTQTQILVQMPGTGNAWWNIFLPGVLICIVCVVIIAFYHRKRMNKKRTADDSVS